MTTILVAALIGITPGSAQIACNIDLTMAWQGRRLVYATGSKSRCRGLDTTPLRRR